MSLAQGRGSQGGIDSLSRPLDRSEARFPSLCGRLSPCRVLSGNLPRGLAQGCPGSVCGVQLAPRPQRASLKGGAGAVCRLSDSSSTLSASGVLHLCRAGGSGNRALVRCSRFTGLCERSVCGSYRCPPWSLSDPPTLARAGRLARADRALFLQTWLCRTSWATRSVGPPGSPCTTAGALAGKKVPEGQWRGWGLPASLEGPSELPLLRTPHVNWMWGPCPGCTCAVSCVSRHAASHLFRRGSPAAVTGVLRGTVRVILAPSFDFTRAAGLGGGNLVLGSLAPGPVLPSQACLQPKPRASWGSGRLPPGP